MKKINIKKSNKGFVLLFTVVLSSIIFAIAMSILKIAFTQSIINISGRASNEAFYAADTGAECALYYDLRKGVSIFGEANPDNGPNCAGIDLDLYQGNTAGPWTFYLYSLGYDGRACAIVQVDKSDPASTKIVSRGYSTGGNTTDCSSSSANRVERRLEVTY
jgi:hypothetical protein